jgi:heme exporter protein A
VSTPHTTLSAERLAKSFSGPPLFSGLDLRLDRGLLAVAGKNGSGKTTLLKILAGLLRPSEGRVLVERDGRPLAGEARRLAVGFAGPDLSLYAELTALENLRFFRAAAGSPAEDAELRRRLEETGLAGEAVARRVEEFSTGMRQRLRLAFAGLFDPPVLVLDEPMSGLDTEGREMVQRFVAQARTRGPVVLASNDERDFVQPEHRIELSADASRRTET